MHGKKKNVKVVVWVRYIYEHLFYSLNEMVRWWWRRRSNNSSSEFYGSKTDEFLTGHSKNCGRLFIPVVTAHRPPHADPRRQKPD